jgi:hypothetical protein
MGNQFDGILIGTPAIVLQYMANDQHKRDSIMAGRSKYGQSKPKNKNFSIQLWDEVAEMMTQAIKKIDKKYCTKGEQDNRTYIHNQYCDSHHVIECIY